MRRAIETVDARVARLDCSEITALESIGQILIDELSFHENRRVKTALAELSFVRRC